ncbi:MAG TPA: hypothetical protein PKK17_10975 [Sphingorhabdus lacus]|nr:hypothetical protein [Sphingorhabdus lacus]HPV68921.1 hypothetical protein [Sphingorhabdus lacus]
MEYKANGDAWMLSVSDNGLCMAKEDEDHRPGLETGIVEALTAQLDALVSIANQSPGTKIIIRHIA